MNVSFPHATWDGGYSIALPDSFHYIPEAQLLVIADPSGTSLILKHFDVSTALQAAGLPSSAIAFGDNDRQAGRYARETIRQESTRAVNCNIYFVSRFAGAARVRQNAKPRDVAG